VEEKNKDCCNPNVVLCNGMSAIGVMVGRFPGVTNRRSVLDHFEILGVLPAMVHVLDTEGRNNGACGASRGSLEAIIEATGAPEALEAYLHNLKAPKCDSEWMRKHTARYHGQALAYLQEVTGRSFGTDFDTWRTWFSANEGRLVYHSGRKRFVVDPRSARAYRAHLARALRRKSGTTR
jgi:hypothetical protein